MALLETFESTLKEVVQAKRLSASKMTKLTEIALKAMENDTQLVSILYRTHKSLPAAAKVSSLYAFDALARAAKSQVTKHGLTGDINAEKGNCATFLLKIEGVLDGLFQDMIAAGNTETKEKSKKILDIWAKANTFPPAVLASLTNVVQEAEKERSDVKGVPPDPKPVQGPEVNPSIPREPAEASPPVNTNVAPVQSALLALLTQAASAVPNNGQTIPNTGTTPQLDASQLALLQQLAHTAKLSNGVPPQPIPFPAQPSLTTSVFPEATGGPSQPNSYRNDYQDPGRRELRYGGDNSPPRPRYDHHEDRTTRGGFRGGFRGRGREDGRSQRDYRDSFRDKDRDRSPPYRARRSRSRSPPSRYGGRRDIKPYSPPRRPSIAQPAVREPSNSAESVSDAPEAAKDEFGRDIRPSSPKVERSASKEDREDGAVIRTAPGDSATTPQNPTLDPSSAVITNTSPQVTDAVQSGSSSSVTLNDFDSTTFDFTSPASWEALGTMWKASYGYAPSQEELMQFVCSGGMINPTTMSTMEQGWSGVGWVGSNSNRGRGQPWRGGRGRGEVFPGQVRGYGHDSSVQGSYDQEMRVAEREESTVQSMDDGSASAPAGGGPQATSQVETTGGSGRMQRVGDKWVFVRKPPPAAS